MIKLNPDETAHQIKAYLRNENYQKSVLVEEQTNVKTEVVFNITAEQKHFILSTGVLPVKEGYFYVLKSYDTNGLLIHKEKLFATNQTENYSVNKGAYKTAESTDDKIMLG